jgi:hypothetical protein
MHIVTLERTSTVPGSRANSLEGLQGLTKLYCLYKGESGSLKWVARLYANYIL